MDIWGSTSDQDEWIDIFSHLRGPGAFIKVRNLGVKGHGWIHQVTSAGQGEKPRVRGMGRCVNLGGHEGVNN